MKRVITVFLVVFFSGSVFQTGFSREKGDLSPVLRSALLKSLQRGLVYLKNQQKSDGSWEHHPGITSLTCLAFLKGPDAQSATESENILKALTYLAGLAKEDGGIYQKDLLGYTTSLTMRALIPSGNPEYKPLIE